LPGHQWFVDDTYPNVNRDQELFLFHPPSDQRITLGKFKSPQPYVGEWRSATPPRLSRNGRLLVIDSPHNGEGRQMHLIDLGFMLS